ncbi:MAG: DUF421 domain-containing protein [Bacillota bacterium]|nr:DUF421 domain-containing protein [Bacillota bacterium]
MPFWESQESLTVLQWMLRTAVMFWWLLFMTKLMGQRQIGRLTVFDFIVAFTVGGIAAGVLNNTRNGLVGAITTIGTLAALDIAVSFLALKNAKIRRILQDEPLVLIQNGRLIEDMMRKARFNLDDLLLELRQNNIANLHDVEFAILESNGKLSVIPKSQARPLQPSDLQIPTNYEGMPTVLIEDGNIIEDNLRRINLDKTWLLDQLRQRNIDNPGSVLVAMLDTLGKLYISKKNERFIH